MTDQSTHPPAAENRLRKNVLGVPSIFFYVIAAASPLTVVIALLPIMIGLGNGVGAAGAFVLAAVALLVFAAGYVSMSRHITNTGAFYAYVTAGLGREAGLGSAFLTMFGYNAIQAALYGGMGFYLNGLLATHLDIDLPWWLLAIAAIVACTFLDIQGVHSGARVLIAEDQEQVDKALSVIDECPDTPRNRQAYFAPSRSPMTSNTRAEMKTKSSCRVIEKSTTTCPPGSA